MNRSPLLIVFLITLASLPTEGQVYSTDNPTRVRKRSPVESDIFLANWWDYYNRAIRRVNEGNYSGAEADLREAIKFRSEDSPHARTFGVRFQEYYPHCELGLIMFDSGRYREAIQEFKQSMKTAPLDESKFFLHESYRPLALDGEIDSAPPQILISEPVQEMITGQTSIRIKGTVRDDVYVDRLSVGGEPYLIDPLQSQVDFEVEVPLKSGFNRISVVATDLADRSTDLEFRITADHFGPAISLKKIELTSNKQQARLVAEIYDTNQISALRINGNPFAVPSGQTRVSVDQVVTLDTKNGNVGIEALDGFENNTLALLDPRMKTSAGPKVDRGFQMASLALRPGHFPVSAISRPYIKLKGYKQGQTIYQNEVMVDFEVFDKVGVEEVFCNSDFPSFPTGTLIFQSYRWSDIESGTNTLKILAKNVDGVTSEAALTINCKLIEYDFVDKLSVVIPPIDQWTKPESCSDDLLMDLYTSFSVAIGERNRFNQLQGAETKFIESSLMEKKLAVSPMVAPNERQKIASFRVPDYLLEFEVNAYQKGTMRIVLRARPLSEFGSIAGKPGSEFRVGPVDVTIQVRPTTIEIESRVEERGYDLALRLESEFPKVDGEILGVAGTSVIGSLTTRSGVRSGREVVAFNERAPERFGDQRILNRGEPIPLGTLNITRLFQDRCFLKPVSANINDLREKLLILTR